MLGACCLHRVCAQGLLSQLVTEQGRGSLCFHSCCERSQAKMFYVVLIFRVMNVVLWECKHRKGTGQKKKSKKFRLVRYRQDISSPNRIWDRRKKTMHQILCVQGTGGSRQTKQAVGLAGKPTPCSSSAAGPCSGVCPQPGLQGMRRLRGPGCGLWRSGFGLALPGSKPEGGDPWLLQ